MSLFKNKEKIFKRSSLLLVFFICFLFLGIGRAHAFSGLDLLDIGAGSLLKFVNVILFAIYSLVLALFDVSMWLLDLVISPELYSSIFFSEVAKAGINTAWSFVRDFFNLFFILIIVLIGLSVILGVGDFKNKARLIKVAFAAMLINFSKPITLFVIDASQIFMRFFAESITKMQFGSQLSKQLGFEKIIVLTDGGAGFEHNFAYFTVIVIVIIMLVIMTVMIFHLAVSLIVRMISFWVLIIVSPLAMFGLAMEGTKLGSMTNDWFKRLTSWCFYGPIFLFFLWLSIILVSALTGAMSEAGSVFNSVVNVEALKTKGMTSNFFATLAGMLIPYITAIYLLFYGYDKAKEASDGMATKILNAGSKKISQLGAQARKAAYQGTLPGTRQAIKEGVTTRVEKRAGEGGWISKRLTKKGREDIQAQKVAKMKKRIGGDKGVAEKEYYRGKAQEKIAKWKDNPPTDSKLKEMFVSERDEEKLAATLYMSQNNDLGFDKEGNNLYNQAMSNLEGYSGLQEKVTRETKRENLGAFVDREVANEVIKKNEEVFQGLVPGTDRYNKALEANGIKEKVFDKTLNGNLNQIFKNQNENLYKQPGVLDYLYEKHKDKDPGTRRKFGENIKGSKEEAFLKESQKGRVLLGIKNPPG